MPRVFMLSCGLGGAGLSAHASSIIIPDGLSPGDTFQLAFVTSDRITAQSGDIDLYNNFVTTAAAAAGLNVINGQHVSWTAMVSTPFIDAHDNAPQTAPVYNLQMQLVTAAPGSLWGGFPVVLNNPIDTTEFGNPWSGEYVWTGTDIDGQARPNISLGANFLIASYGNSTSIFSSWIDSGILSIRTKLPIYALSSPIMVPVPGGGGTTDPGGGTTDPGGGTTDPGGGTTDPGDNHAVPEAPSLHLGLLGLLTLLLRRAAGRFGILRRGRRADQDVEGNQSG